MSLIDFEVVADVGGLDVEEQFRQVVVIDVDGHHTCLSLKEDGFFMEARDLQIDGGEVVNSEEPQDVAVDDHPWVHKSWNIRALLQIFKVENFNSFAIFKDSKQFAVGDSNASHLVGSVSSIVLAAVETKSNIPEVVDINSMRLIIENQGDSPLSGVENL